MEKDWSVVYKAGNEYQAKILKGMLKENGIDSVIINQKDSAYLFGSSLLYVRNDNYDKARQLVLSTEGNPEVDL
jgi:hypothetical protein